MGIGSGGLGGGSYLVLCLLEDARELLGKIGVAGWDPQIPATLLGHRS